jgi:hypothetical protein
MEKQVAVIVGVGAVAAAIVGGLGWKTVKARKGDDKLTPEQMEERKAILRARVQQTTTQKVEVAITETVIEKAEGADMADKKDTDGPFDFMTYRSPSTATSNVSLDFEQAPGTIPSIRQFGEEMMASSSEAILEQVKDRNGDKVVSISRPRAVLNPVQPDQSPVFWSSFVAKLRRPDVIELSSVDFETRNTELARGYHKCSVDGVAGVLHVTKSNVSAVLHLGGDEFTGISTSASRFHGKGLVNLTQEQAKNFLTGR